MIDLCSALTWNDVCRTYNKYKSTCNSNIRSGDVSFAPTVSCGTMIEFAVSQDSWGKLIDDHVNGIAKSLTRVPNNN